MGVGRGMGYIDLPIDRDGITNWPIIRASAFKGVWADYFKANEENRKNDPHLRAAFGISGAENDSNSGSLIPTDAKLVCLPVRSFLGTFAWVTSPLCLVWRNSPRLGNATSIACGRFLFLEWQTAHCL